MRAVTPPRSPSTDEPPPRGAARGAIAAAAVVIVIAGIRAAEAIVVPFLLALFITIITTPALAWLQRLRVPTVISVILVIVVLISLVVAIPIALEPSITGLMRRLPAYAELLRQREHELSQQLVERGVIERDTLLADSFNPAFATRMLAQLLNGLLNVFKNILIILILVAFMLAEASWLPQKLETAFGSAGGSTERVNRIARDVRRYLGIKTGISMLTGILIWFGLALLGVDNAGLWGLLAFLMNYIPNVGSLLAAIPPVLLAWIDNGLATAAWAALLFLVVNQLLGNIIEPRLQGAGLGLSPLIVFASLVFWGWVLGPVGMLLSAPLTATVKIVVEGMEETRWIAVLMGGKPEPAVTNASRRAARTARK